MAKRHKPTAEVEVLILDSDSSEGESEDHVPHHWPEDLSEVSENEDYNPPNKKGKHRHATKLHGSETNTNTNANRCNVSTTTNRDDACEDAQQSEPLLSWTIPNVVQPVLPPFTATWGCRVNTDGFLPINYFQLFLDDEFFKNLIQHTNSYAQYFLEQEKKLGGCPESSQWIPTNLSEMRKFWGLTLNMGIIQKPSIVSYWALKHSVTNPVFTTTMSLNRFLLLQKFLHYNDNTQTLPPNHPEYDDLFKVRPVLDHLLKRFQEVYIPGQNLVVNSSLLSYKGRVMCQDFFTKREKFCKLHSLCESSTGYTYRFQVCLNEVPNLGSHEGSSDFGVSEKIIDDLVHPLYNQGYHLYMNHSYCSPTLLRFLYTKGTLACGTVHHSKKGFPRELKIRKQKKGETALQRCEELLAVRYKGSKDILLLTTIHDESTLAFAMEEEQNVTKPKSLLDYNYYMAGVERAGQMLEQFIAYNKGNKWYKRLVVYMVQLAMFNAYVVYHQTTAEKRLSFAKFQESVIKTLLENEQFSIDAEEPQVEERLVGRHFPERIPPTTKAHPAKRCRVCTRQGIRRDTRYYCPDCTTKPPLCLQTCFRTYHTKETF